jgi:6-phosphogluconolactonase
MISATSRREFLSATSGALALGALLPSLLAMAAEGQAEQKMLAYFGTYTGGKSEGIYVAEFDPATGKLGEPKLAAKSLQPSFLAIHPSKKYLYACNETADFEGKNSGAVTAYAIQADGTLTQLNQKSSSGAAPCHLVVDPTGKNVLTANYTGGNVCVYALGDDGQLGAQTAFVQHTGSSVDSGRQQQPHAHSINVDAANRFALAADLGLDKVLIYKFDPAKGTLAPNDPPAGLLPKGGGPRHFAFHPSGKYAYVNNEMLSSVTVFAYDAQQGALKELQTISTLPEEVKGNSTAEVQVHPSGKFVYVSNRGHNSIAIFQVDEATGKLTAAGHQGKDINIPRNFSIDPTGKWAVVCNQEGNNVLVFQVDQANGSLVPTEHRIEVGNPVCVKFLTRT